MPTDSTHPTVRQSRSHRQDLILNELNATPTLRASDLSQRLGVSHETIRRDLIDLDRRGLLRRTYGGAARPFRFEAPLAERQKMHVRARDRIAADTAALIAPNEVVMIGSGSTAWHAARHIAATCRNVTAITNDHNVADALCQNPSVQVICLGGRLHPGERYVYGTQTLQELAGYRANWAVIGASGIDEDGAHDIDDQAAGIYRAMIHRAVRVALLADQSKFGVPALARIAGWDAIDLLVTDAPPQGRLAEALAAQDVTILHPSGGNPLSANLAEDRR